MNYTGSLRPIDTYFGGHRFRSRLEARWAVFFNKLGVTFDYEPEGFKLAGGLWYLPDFWLPQVSMWAEVKPNDCRDRLVIDFEAIQKAAGLSMESNHAVLILDGRPRDVNYWALYPELVDPVGWDWVDVLMTDPNEYHLTESRFYASTGANYPEHLPDGQSAWMHDGLTHPAVLAAQQARFEHGERP